MDKKDAEALRGKILQLVKEYYMAAHSPKPYQTGEPIRYAGRVYDEREMLNLVDASLEFWLTAGKWTGQFEDGLAKFLGVKYCSLVNSGSSANLLAFMALTSPKLGKRRILPGDEVITIAAAFPTTVAPIIQHGAMPVFIDVELNTCNIDVAQLEAALSLRTRAVMIAHTLGNPFDLRAVRDFCKAHDLWLIEDNCDALGSQYYIDEKWQYTGTVGDIGTSSFYPPHHITLGEGGAVYTNDMMLHRIVNSLRDWGRDCWCPSGKDGSCGKRFTQQFGELPLGYDHKYVYSHFGYNLKATDMQAAIGCAQLEKLPDFVEARRHNWQFLNDALAPLEDVFILPKPAPDSKPSWFGFLLMVREDAPFKRVDVVKTLEAKGIQTRMLFAGNLVKHPCFDAIRETNAYRISGSLANTDFIMNNAFWVGVYPGMNDEMLDYMAKAIKEAI